MKTPKTVYALFRQGAKRWIKKAYARTSPRGKEVYVTDDKAECFCLVGALIRVYGWRTVAFGKATEKLRAVIGTPCIPEWNDKPNRTFSEVLAAVRKAGI